LCTQGKITEREHSLPINTSGNTSLLFGTRASPIE
jgi:hypothetical protein